jgi:enoyl-CoA hydratase/carnithine racemase
MIMEANKAATPTGAKHTATPWHRNIKPAAKYPVIFAGQNTHVAQVVAWGLPDEVVEANLEFIVRACNAHDDLVKALKVARDCIELLAEAPSTLEIIDAALTKAGA